MFSLAAKNAQASFSVTQYRKWRLYLIYSSLRGTEVFLLHLQAHTSPPFQDATYVKKQLEKHVTILQNKRHFASFHQQPLSSFCFLLLETKFSFKKKIRIDQTYVCYSQKQSLSETRRGCTAEKRCPKPPTSSQQCTFLETWDKCSIFPITYRE